VVVKFGHSYRGKKQGPRVSERKVLKGILRHEAKNDRGVSYSMLITRYYLGNQTKHYAMGIACRADIRNEKFTHSFRRKT
jgi:hypothetical protein